MLSFWEFFPDPKDNSRIYLILIISIFQKKDETFMMQLFSNRSRMRALYDAGAFQQSGEVSIRLLRIDNLYCCTQWKWDAKETRIPDLIMQNSSLYYAYKMCQVARTRKRNMFRVKTHPRLPREPCSTSVYIIFATRFSGS